MTTFEAPSSQQDQTNTSQTASDQSLQPPPAATNDSASLELQHSQDPATVSAAQPSLDVQDSFVQNQATENTEDCAKYKRGH